MMTKKLRKRKEAEDVEETYNNRPGCLSIPCHSSGKVERDPSINIQRIIKLEQVFTYLACLLIHLFKDNKHALISISNRSVTGLWRQSHTPYYY